MVAAASGPSPGEGPSPVVGLELADAVDAVRQGLLEGAARGAAAPIRFEVGEIRMDFTVELVRTRTDRGGVKAWVVEAGGDRSRAEGRTHTVSLTLRPRNAATGGYVEIGVPPARESADLGYDE